MADSKNPWWRRALRFALNGLRTGFGIFGGSKSEAGQNSEAGDALQTQPAEPQSSEPASIEPPPPEPEAVAASIATEPIATEPIATEPTATEPNAAEPDSTPLKEVEPASTEHEIETEPAESPAALNPEPAEAPKAEADTRAEETASRATEEMTEENTEERNPHLKELIEENLIERTPEQGPAQAVSSSAEVAPPEQSVPAERPIVESEVHLPGPPSEPSPETQQLATTALHEPERESPTASDAPPADTPALEETTPEETTPAEESPEEATPIAAAPEEIAPAETAPAETAIDESVLQASQPPVEIEPPSLPVPAEMIPEVDDQPVVESESIVAEPDSPTEEPAASETSAETAQPAQPETIPDIEMPQTPIEVEQSQEPPAPYEPPAPHETLTQDLSTEADPEILNPSAPESEEPGNVEVAAAAEPPATVKEEPSAPAPPPAPAVPARTPIVAKAKEGDENASPFSIFVGQVYDGPLDLLLDLIRKQDIDIYDIPIARITAQFLAYVNQLKASDVDVAGEFIYTASLLIHIKSKMLLPRETGTGDDAHEDPRRELVERLLEHERFKNAAQMLQQKQMLEAASWTNPGLREFQEDAGAEPEIAADTDDLVRIFRDILDRARRRPVIDVADEQVTVGQMIQFLTRRLSIEDKPIALRRLLAHTRSERTLIATFLALLELVRLQAILLRQDAQFSEIFIKKNTGFDSLMNEGVAQMQDDWR